MNATKLNDWMQVIGIFTVVASLIFVGLEMRQAQEISMSQAYQSRAAAVVEWDSAFAANPAALSAQRKAASGAADEITTVASAIFLKKVDQGIRPDFRDVVLKISKELETQPNK